MERVDGVVWHGSLIEQLDLLAAVEHNCDCRYDVMEQRVSVCASHTMLAGDQRALNGLLWNRRLVQRLRVEEGVPAP